MCGRIRVKKSRIRITAKIYSSVASPFRKLYSRSWTPSWVSLQKDKPKTQK